MKERSTKKYEICNTLATGGTAVLYKAIQTSLDRPVVIKRLHSHLISDPDFTRRFQLEAKAVASLDHENIVRIIDFGSSENNYYIVMEYIDGPSLKDILSSRRVLSEELTLLIAREICLGLDHAHQRGIIHRDVKPANIMITTEGQVKITDFGLAKLNQSQTQQTVASTLLGTPLYMSPEQAIGEAIDGRSDLFSLGTICYEAMTGTQPFFNENYAAVIQNIINDDVAAPSKIRRDVDASAEAIVMKALNREPGRRFRNALEMAQAIESLLGQEKILAGRTRLRRLATGEDDIVSTPKRPRRAKGRRRKLLPLGLAASAAVALILVFALNPWASGHLANVMKALRDRHPAAPGAPIEAAQGEGIMITPLEATPAPETTRTDSLASPDTAKAVETAPVADMPPEPPQQAAPPADSLGASAPSRVHKAQHKEAQETGYIEISIEPSAEILIDNEIRVVGNHLAMLELSAGTHEITCRSSGYRDYVESMQIQRGELSRRTIYLEAIMGTITVETLPGAQVYIDGVLKGTTPLRSPLKASAGSHNVQLKRAGFQPWQSSVYVPPDETIRLPIDLVPISRTR